MESSTPFFSAVIPVYNKGPHVARAIRSVLAQTWQNYELLLINDASTDESLEEMQKYTDPRIRILHRDTPGPGGYAARNLGIREAKAEWVAFLDADDEWYPEHLERMKELIQAYSHVKFFSCGWETSMEGRKKQDSYYQNNMHRGQHEINCEDYLRLSIKGGRPAWTGVTVISKTIPFAPTLFPEDKQAKRGGDLHAWLKLICSLKIMAWSPHIGAVYHRDCVNMVTKTAPESYHLMTKDVYNGFVPTLNIKEANLLKIHLNKRLISSWVGCIMRHDKSFFLPLKLFWRGNMLFALKWSLLVFIPHSLLRFLYRMRSKYLNRDP
ncbi:MAG: glycosyltransferase family 2 protein [Synergistaceae bacterium]|nr:glycosyltransferase family 2 protein [Synergistaceae bacterium]